MEFKSKPQIFTEPTPNPNALKFVTDRAVKSTGKASYKRPSETEGNPLAAALFTVRGVDQVHFFDNTITVSKFNFEDWEVMEPTLMECLEQRLADHDPSFESPDPEEKRRQGLSPELQKIEGVLDKTIRPGLQADGGDLICLSLNDNILMVRYQGACGTCPSSTMGTLEAIRGILREQHDPKIEVYIQPE